MLAGFAGRGGISLRELPKAREYVALLEEDRAAARLLAAGYQEAEILSAAAQITAGRRTRQSPNSTSTHRSLKG
jgi:hypothetical protein